MPARSLVTGLFAVSLVLPLGCATQDTSLAMNDSLANNALPTLAVASALDTPTGSTGAAAQRQQDLSQPSANTQALADPWPRQVTLANASALIYLPQVEGWQGNQLHFRAAIAIKPNAGNEQTFGVVWGSARTDVDRLTRTVRLSDLVLSKASFPTFPDNGLDALGQLRNSIPAVMATMSLDLLQGQLAASQTGKPQPVAINNDPPHVLVSTSPAILVPIDGTPVIKPVPDSRFERVLNTQALIARPRLDSMT